LKIKLKSSKTPDLIDYETTAYVDMIFIKLRKNEIFGVGRNQDGKKELHSPNYFTYPRKNENLLPSRSLTYANCVIYAAACVKCNQQYVGQTVNKFSTSWSSHRSNWNKPNNKD